MQALRDLKILTNIFSFLPLIIDTEIFTLLISFSKKFTILVHNVKLNADFGNSENNNGSAEKLKEHISTDRSQ